MHSKRIVITGGAGFIGSHLCERLLGEGHAIVCLDNLYTGSRHNIEHMLGHPRFEFVRHDVCEPFHFEADQIFHLACPASPIHYQRNPVRTITTCVVGTLHALEAARAAGARLFVASTSEIYGDPAVHPQSEDYWGQVNPIGIRACYDEGKRCAEALAFNFSQQYDVPIRVARIFNTYGPRMDENDGRVISNFTVQALRGEPMTIYGDGTQTRSFCYVDDLVEGAVRLMNAEHVTGPVNLGNPVEVTIEQIARAIRDLTESRSEFAFAPLPQDDPTHRRPDVAKARGLFDWNPGIGLVEGLRRTIADFSRRLGLPDSTSAEVPHVHWQVSR
ncbi:UDP-glucuronic acid decarboxylase family protein [Nocardia amamiensis]|uniref:UDP-glucuronic acid decarboxylase family protein n=1 Tax=Nocardia amamiensis TaxID=404578 RepID=UPI00082A9516|nr:UDP-glucuronic acid decarboxylase family protein [Nocardia amamiensis]